MDTLTFLIWLTAGVLGLNVLAFFTERAHDYLARCDREPREPPSRPPTGAVVVQVAPPVTTVPAEETAGHWWKRLFTPMGMFGLLVGPLQIPILVINSELLAATFETVLDRPGTVIMVINIFGWVREITNFDLYGLLISLGEMTAAAALHLAWHERQRLWLVFGLALTALLSLVAYEVGASIYRGWIVDGSLQNAGLSGLLALGVAITGATVGAPLVERFLIPLLLAVLWSLATPCRAIAHWWARRRAVRGTEVRPRRHNQPHPLVLAVVYPFAAIDKALMAPLRRFDRAVGSLLPDRTRRESQGGHSHATPQIAQNLASVHLSGDGSDPTRMRGDQRQSTHDTDRLDSRA
jgi:hypothetical protein